MDVDPARLPWFDRARMVSVGAGSSPRPCLLAVPVMGVILSWAVHHGGYYAPSWYPVTLLVAVLLLMALVVAPGSRICRSGTVALVAFAAYVAWSYLSVLWAQGPADALDGSNRAALYLLCFALFAVLPWRLRAAAAALGLFIVTVAGVGLVTVIRMALDSSPAHLLSVTRLQAPVGYQNADGAFWLMGAAPAVLGSACTRLPVVARALLLAFGGLLIDLAVLTQSRGALLALPIALMIALVLLPNRRPAMLATMTVAVTTVGTLPWLLRVFQAGEGVGLATAVHHAALASLAHGLMLVAVGAMLAAPNGRPAQSGRARALRWATVAAVLVVGVMAAAATATGHVPGFTSTHLADDDPGRFDLWRVGLKVARWHPVAGLGQDNFADAYLRYRNTTLVTHWTHSLELRLLVHTGIVGVVLFAVFVAAGLRVALARRQVDAGPRTLMILATLPALLWLVHGSIDWLWEFPVLTVPALAGLGLAVALGSQSDGEERPSTAMERRWRRVAGSAILAVSAAVIAPYLSCRDVAAAQTWRSDPGHALRRLSHARWENLLSPRPDVVAGLISVQRDDLVSARARFAAALDRQRSDWFASFAIGLVETAQGNASGARIALERARAMNPREPLISLALVRLGTASPLTFKNDEGVLRPEMLAMTTIGGPLDYASGVVRGR